MTPLKPRKASDMEIKKLIAVAAGEIHHIYNGLCPDSQTGANSRDDECPACQIIIAAETESAKARGVAINLDETRLNELARDAGLKEE